MGRPNSSTELRDDQRRLIREIEVLQRCEKRTGLRAKPVIDQLIADSERPLPDRLPSRPECKEFKWSAGVSLDFTNHWREVDRNPWLQPTLGTK